jgi:hypothetical protein
VGTVSSPSPSSMILIKSSRSVSPMPTPETVEF